MDRRTIEVPSIYPMTWQYSPAISVSGGRTVYISGVIGARPDGSIPVGDIGAQAELAFSNLEQVVLAAGGTMRDIVKVNVYVGEEYAGRAAELRAIRQRYFPSDYPTSTLVRVAGFANPDYLFEIEAVAVVSESPAGDAPAGGLVVVAPDDRIINGAEQTVGMVRESGVTPETAGSRSLWSGYVTTPPGMVSGAHHHGDAESSIYVVSGAARFTWGQRLEHGRVAGPGDFIYVPPRVIHAEENLSTTEPFVFVVSRNSGTMTTVNVEVGAPSCDI
jgi:2-iminobutanoate/2-iminopropanoate deaminase